MRRHPTLLVGAVLALVCSTSVALATPPVGVVQQTSRARGTMVEAATIRAEMAKDMLFAKYTLDPGAGTGWYDDPGAVIFVVNRGVLTLVEGAQCAATTLQSGQSIVTTPGEHSLQNKGKETLEVVVVHVGLPVSGPTPYLEGETGGSSCAGRAGEVSVEVLGRGPFVARGSGDRHWGDGTRPLEIQKDMDVSVVQYNFSPDSSSGWHNHPGPAVGVVTRGMGRSYEGHDGQCSYAEYKAGEAVMVFNDHQHLITNESSTEPLEFFTAFVNVPKGKAIAALDDQTNHHRDFLPSDGCTTHLGVVPVEKHLER